MKTYGEKLVNIRNEDFTTKQSGYWLGSQSRKVAHRRARDKKLLHRRERRTIKQNNFCDDTTPL